ncbi:MAG: sulfotransferase family protein [Gammaproteobacteria bacterium]
MAKLKNTKALLVLGMHRSGTSALTGTLNLLGIHVGDSLIPASEDVNPKGFWEHAGVVDLHERLLASIGSSWSDERSLPQQWWLLPEVQLFRQELVQMLEADFAKVAVWAIKDPRMCRLMPLWHQVFEDLGCSPRVVIILRDPREVARSLAIRDGISEERSALLWLQHLLNAEKWTRKYPRTIITFEGLLENWRTAAERIESELEMPLKYLDAEVQRRVDSFLEPTLRHHAFVGSSSGAVTKLALEVYRILAELHDTERLEASLEGVDCQAASFERLVAPWSDEVQALRRELYVRGVALEELNYEVSRIKGTFSWRVTAPLRGMWNSLCKVFCNGVRRP